MVLYLSLRDSKSSQVSRTLLSILADFNIALFWTVSTRPTISKSFSLCTTPLVTFPRAPITITLPCSKIFFNFLVDPYPSFCFLSVLLSGSLGLQSPQSCKFSFLLIIIRSGGVCESHSPGQILGCASTIGPYAQTSVTCTIPNWLPCSPSRVKSYSFCANLLHLLWFCCVLSVLTLIWLVLVALFCAAIRRGSVSCVRFFFFLASATFSRVRCYLLVI